VGDTTLDGVLAVSVVVLVSTTTSEEEDVSPVGDDVSSSRVTSGGEGSAMMDVFDDL
jgi:hypothetical protein